MSTDPSEFDIFRDDLSDRPSQGCDNYVECAVLLILGAIGEDPNREGLVRTPLRVARMFEEMTAGATTSTRSNWSTKPCLRWITTRWWW